LKVRATTETVEVTDSGIEILDSGEKAALITLQQFEDLSLVDRNATECLKLLPGATLAAKQWPE